MNLLSSWQDAQTYLGMCNVDAAFSRSINIFGIGMCIRDDHEVLF
jgi:hypothetical protein